MYIIHPYWLSSNYIMVNPIKEHKPKMLTKHFLQALMPSNKTRVTIWRPSPSVCCFAIVCTTSSRRCFDRRLLADSGLMVSAALRTGPWIDVMNIYCA